MGHHISVAFPKNITLLDFFRVILVHKKLFLFTSYQLTNSAPKKNRPVRDRICPFVTRFMLKYWSNQKNTLQISREH